MNQSQKMTSKTATATATDKIKAIMGEALDFLQRFNGRIVNGFGLRRFILSVSRSRQSIGRHQGRNGSHAPDQLANRCTVSSS